MSKKLFTRSEKLNSVSYDIRGVIHKEALRLENSGEKILKLNIGNPGAFGFDAPSQLVEKIKSNLENAKGYCHSQGIIEAREAIANYNISKGIKGVVPDDIYIGNGASELIVMVMQALVNSGDEVLVPAPDYPLWTAAVNLANGKATHYLCDEDDDWNPDIADMEKKISEKTKAIVIINPNNPTGAVYSDEILKKIVALAEKHNLMILADEIYDKILYDGISHTSIASLSEKVLFITFNGLSKSYLSCGYRSGWMTVSGAKNIAEDFIEGLTVMSSMRLCSNVPSQYAIPEALTGFQDIDLMVATGGRLCNQRDFIYETLNEIDGISCVKPKGALYVFPKIDANKFNITNDTQFVLDLLKSKKILVVHGTGFNWSEPNHFRIVALPKLADLKLAVTGIKDFLKDYRQ